MNGSRHILIVDDNAEFAGMAAEAVRDVSDQFEVRVTTSAEAAIAEIQGAQDSARSYDLVITDIKMPGSSGLQLIKTLAEIAPKTKTITMTAYHSPELAEQAQELQVCAYLIKPIALSEFRQVVRAALPSAPASADASAPSRQLPAAQKTAVERRLANLRSITNSMTALLAHVDGTILAADRLDMDTDADALCEALIDSMQTIAQAMRHALNTDAPIQQSYYGTEAFSICTYRMDRSHVIVTVFGPTVREGHVWYCMREAAKELISTLTSKGDDETSPRAQAGDAWRAKMEQYFTETPMQRARKRRTAPHVEQHQLWPVPAAITTPIQPPGHAVGRFVPRALPARACHVLARRTCLDTPQGTDPVLPKAPALRSRPLCAARPRKLWHYPATPGNVGELGVARPEFGIHQQIGAARMGLTWPELQNLQRAKVAITGAPPKGYWHDLTPAEFRAIFQRLP